MRRKRLAPGTIFRIPLEQGLVAYGVAMRVSPDGTSLSYFYRPQDFQSLPITLDDLREMEPLLKGMHGTLGFKDAEATWEEVGMVENYDPEWTWPIFFSPNFTPGKGIIQQYDPVHLDYMGNISEEIDRRPGFAEAGLMGHKVVEHRLLRFLRADG